MAAKWRNYRVQYIARTGRYYIRTVPARSKEEAIAKVRKNLLQGRGYISITTAWPREEPGRMHV